MFVQPFLSAVPSGVLDMTTTFALLFGGMAVVLGLCVFGLVAATRLQDIWWEQSTDKKAPYRLAPAFQFPGAM